MGRNQPVELGRRLRRWMRCCMVGDREICQLHLRNETQACLDIVKASFSVSPATLSVHRHALNFGPHLFHVDNTHEAGIQHERLE